MSGQGFSNDEPSKKSSNSVVHADERCLNLNVLSNQGTLYADLPSHPPNITIDVEEGSLESTGLSAEPLTRRYDSTRDSLTGDQNKQYSKVEIPAPPEKTRGDSLKDYKARVYREILPPQSFITIAQPPAQTQYSEYLPLNWLRRKSPPRQRQGRSGFDLR